MIQEPLSPAELQKEVMVWAMKNFPQSSRNPHQALLGINEEVGELFESYYMDNDPMSFDVDQAIDAVGDICIFMCHYSGVNGFNIGDALGPQVGKYGKIIWAPHECLNEVVKCLGKLNHAHLKNEQGIRKKGVHFIDVKMEAIGKILCLLRVWCEHHGLDIAECAQKAWDEVKDRDWVKYPKTGRPDDYKPVVKAKVGIKPKFTSKPRDVLPSGELF